MLITMKTAMAKKETTIDDLATMVQAGFNDIHDQFAGIQGQFVGIQDQFAGIQDQFAEMRAELRRLDNGQTEILLRLDNVPYRFELQELDQRVTRLEGLVDS